MKKLLFLLALTILFSCEKARDPDQCCTECFILITVKQPDCNPVEINYWERYEFCDSTEKANIKVWIAENTKQIATNITQKATCRMKQN